jgi:hypothetical protein
MNKDLPATDNRRWYVFQIEYGGFIPLTIPVHLVPSWVGRRRLRRILRMFWFPLVEGDTNEEGADVLVYEDLIGKPYCADGDEDRTTLFHMNHELNIGKGINIPDAMYKTPFTPSNGICGWEAVGSVAAGSGGSLLLENNVWFHPCLLSGQDYSTIHEVRRLLGLPRLTSIDLVSSMED